MGTATCQEALDNHRVDFDPGSFVPFGTMGLGETDVLLTEISPPDDDGFCSFGNSLWAKKRQIEKAKTVIAEVNGRLIRTCGDNFIHVSEIDYFVEHVSSGRTIGSGSLAGRKRKAPEKFLKDICGHVKSLIHSGDTLQIGVGRTTEPLVGLGLLDGKQDLGWHSEATPPGVIPLIKEGAINGKCKTIHRDLAVVTSVGGGSREDMAWVDGNPLIWMVDVAYLEDPRVIAAHDNFVAVNNALMVDLTGQIGAEGIGQRQIGAAGGQIPFATATWLSRNGRSVTVLPSTARQGRVSRIVTEMPQGTVVTMQRNLADYVVTEFGVAHLKGKSLRERAGRLIELAHPDFRPELRRWAEKRFYP
jgi:4-hydroxybutyrate CoA-transferase